MEWGKKKATFRDGHLSFSPTLNWKKKVEENWKIALGKLSSNYDHWFLAPQRKNLVFQNPPPPLLHTKTPEEAWEKCSLKKIVFIFMLFFHPLAQTHTKLCAKRAEKKARAGAENFFQPCLMIVVVAVCGRFFFHPSNISWVRFWLDCYIVVLPRFMYIYNLIVQRCMVLSAFLFLSFFFPSICRVFGCVCKMTIEEIRIGFRKQK